ncbi:MAG: creatininase family protein [Chloroflexi bacterium]|nr:creatininase family protein [Chloroflexota bacterium]
MQGVLLSHLTWFEAQAAVKTHPIAVIPIGAGTKEHGPHLPCGTDQMVVEELARRVVEACPVILMPTLPYGYFPAFIDFPGSVSIRPEYFMGVVGDIIRSLARHGTHKFLILDGGVSTFPPMRTLAMQLHNELGIQVALTNILGLGAEVEKEISEQASGGHADEMETSNMLFIRPDLVKMERAVDEVLPAIPGTRGPSGAQKIYVAGRMTTPSGINGSATLAKRDKGERLLAAMAQDIIDFLIEFAKSP